MGRQTALKTYSSTPLPMNIATIVGDLMYAPPPKYDQTNCCICNKDLSEPYRGFFDPYHDHPMCLCPPTTLQVGCFCAPCGYDPWENEVLWENGYCGKMCCNEEACIGAFRGKKKKEAEKCIACYALVNLDPDFAVMTSEDEDY